MPLNFTVKFHTSHGYYAFRVWESGVYDSGFLKIPDHFWQSLGHETPRALPTNERARKTLEQLAAGWAAKERDRRAMELRNKALGVASGVMTLRQVFELYSRVNPKGVSEETLERDRSGFAAICRHPEIIDVDHDTPMDLDEPKLVRYRNERKSDKVLLSSKGQLRELDKIVRHRTVNNELDLLLRLARFAKRWESETGATLIRVDEIEFLPEQSSTQVALTEDHVAEILKLSKGWRRQAIIFAICSRVREDNLLGLRAEWISWQDSWLNVPAEFVKKGRSRTRHPFSVPLPHIALAQIGNPRLKGYVWSNPETGLPYTKISDLDALARKAGVPEFSEHDLKTTGVTWLKSHGVDPLTLKMLAGHASSRDEAGHTFTVKGSVTDLYSKVMLQHLRDAVAIYDTIFARIFRPDMKVVNIADGRGER